MTKYLGMLLLAGCAFGQVYNQPGTSTNNTWTGAQTFNKQPWTDAVAAGAKCDGTTDDTAAISAALTALYNQGGGTLMIPPGKFCKVTSQLTIPNDGASTPNNKPLRITSWSVANGSEAGGAILTATGGLDLTFNSTTGKIDTRGAGVLEIDHLILKDSASDCASFVFTTNTGVKVHDDWFVGTASGTAACNDAIILGGTGTTIGGSATAPFQGYGTVIRDNIFDKIERIVLGQTFANGVQVVNNTVNNTSGSSAAAAIEFSPAVGQIDEGNVISGNLIEVINYKYGVWFTGGTNRFNYISGNQFFDSGANNTATVQFDTNSDYNMVLDSGEGKNLSGIVDTDGKNTFISSRSDTASVIPSTSPWTFNNSPTFANTTPFVISLPGGVNKGLDIKNSTTNDEVWQNFVSAAAGWNFQWSPAGGAAETPFVIDRASTTETDFALGTANATNVLQFANTSVTTYRIATHNASGQLFLCGGNIVCHDFVDSSSIMHNDYNQTAATSFSTLPACSGANEGLMRAVTDSTTATWGATIAGSSTNHVLAYCDGTNWTVAAK